MIWTKFSEITMRMKMVSCCRHACQCPEMDFLGARLSYGMFGIHGAAHLIAGQKAESCTCP